MLFVISAIESPCFSATPASGVPCAAPSSFSPWQTLQLSRYTVRNGSCCACVAPAPSMAATAANRTASGNRIDLVIAVILCGGFRPLLS